MPALSTDPASQLRYVLTGKTDDPRGVVMVLHGHGADHADMLSLAGRFAEKLPEVAWLVPDAPFSLEETIPPEKLAAARLAQPDLDLSKHRAWAGSPPEGARPPSEDLEGLRYATQLLLDPAAEALNRLIDGQLERLGLDERSLAIYGFSAGGHVALHTGLSRAAECAAIVSHSGQFFGREEALSKPRTLMIVGEQELAAGRPGQEIFPLSTRLLRELGVPVDEFVVPGLGHGSNARSVAVVCRFLGNALRRGRGASATVP